MIEKYILHLENYPFNELIDATEHIRSVVNANFQIYEVKIFNA